MNNKRILLLCTDEFDKFQYFLALKLSENNVVAAYFPSPGECMFEKNPFNEYTYYKFKEIENRVKLYDVKKIVKQFLSEKKNYKIDYDFLKMIEDNYTHFKNLSLQIMGDQTLSTIYHYRFFWKNPTHDEMLRWIELHYRNALYILNDFKPDYILDVEDDGIARAVMIECAFKKNIPYIIPEYSRLESYIYPSYIFGLGIDNYVKEEYHKNLKGNIKEYEKKVTDWRNKETILAERFVGTVTQTPKKNSIVDGMKWDYGRIQYIRDSYKSKINKKLTKKKSILFSNPYTFAKFSIEGNHRKRKLIVNNEYFHKPVEGERYVYMPLHLIPESTTSVKAPWYVDELNVISQISKALPVGWHLYVKEHPAMLGERPVSFYQSVNKFFNVKMVEINYYSDPKPWIAKSVGVITLTGTSAYECAMMGKRSIMFAETSFSIIDGITVVDSFKQLPTLLRQLGEIDNVNSCAAYIKTIENVGTSINLAALKDWADQCLRGNMTKQDELNANINKLIEFYDKAVERWEEGDI